MILAGWLPRLVIFGYIALWLFGTPSAIALTRGALPSSKHVSYRGGFRFVVSLPSLSYPRNALVPVHIDVTNISDRSVRVRRSRPECPDGANPSAEVVSGTGSIVYPPANPHMSTVNCPYFAQLLSPGKTMSTQSYVVMRDKRIRPVVILEPGSGDTVQNVTVRGKAVAVQLTHEAPPIVTLHPSADDVNATIRSPQPVSGRLMYVDMADCPGTSEGSYVWRRASGQEITPECFNAKDWYGAVGWIGHPIALVNYRRLPS